MARRRHTPEQIIRKLREADRLLGEGADVAEVARHLEVSEQTYHRWRNQFGGMKADDAKRLKELERENARLKRIVAQGARDRRLAGDLPGKLVGPSRRRRAVEMLQERLGVSQRRACAIVGQHRSTQRHQPALADPDRDLRQRLRCFARRHPRWGYRRAHAVLRREGWALNRKKVQRLWREEGLRVPPKRRKRQQLGHSTTPADRLGAERPDHVWALDYQFDVTATGRVIKILLVVDEFTRESLADLVEHSHRRRCHSGCLDKIVGQRGRHSSFVRCDNGPELTANALRDWCRFTGTGTSYIEPGSPCENPGSSPTVPASATSCWPSSSSTPSSKPRSSSPTGASSTTPTASPVARRCERDQRRIRSGDRRARRGMVGTDPSVGHCRPTDRLHESWLGRSSPEGR
jgi:putative transposase